MTDFTMPSLGADMDEGTVVEWLVSPGAVVHKGDLMAVVDTDKAQIEVESFAEGVVAELVVPIGERVPVGTVLARFGPAGAPVAPPEPPESPTQAEPAPEATHARPGRAARPPGAHSPLVRREAHRLGVDVDQVTGTGSGGKVTREDVARAAAAEPAATKPPAAPSPGPGYSRPRVTPYARRLAGELGVDLSWVSPADGQSVRAADVRAADVRAADVRAAVAAPATPAATEKAISTDRAPARPTTDPAARATAMREAIARLMARSKREIPHYYLTTTVDLSAALDWMRGQNADLPLSERLVPAALLLRATALAAARHPALNGFWVEDAFHPGSGVHLGVAVSLRGGGLVAPAIHDADRLSVAETMAAMRDLVTRARAGRLRGAEMTDPTLTVTNLGEQGVESVYGVIYPPQVALVGFGRVSERPWAVAGLLGVRPLTTVTLAADHRATDGFTGGRFLATVDDLLQHPEEL